MHWSHQRILLPHSCNSILLPFRLQLHTYIVPPVISVYYLTLMGIQYFDLLPGSCRQSAELNDVVTFAADNRELCCRPSAVLRSSRSTLACLLSLSLSLFSPALPFSRSSFPILQTAIIAAWLGLNCMSRISLGTAPRRCSAQSVHNKILKSR